MANIARITSTRDIKMKFTTLKVLRQSQSKKKIPPLLPVLEEASVNMQSGLPPLHIEVKAVGDGEISVVDDQDITDVNFYQDQVGLDRQEFIISKLGGTN